MSEKIIDTSLVLDILIAEKDYVRTYRSDHDLWFRVRKDGKNTFEKIAEQWRPEINEVIKEMFRKKKLKYSMCFLESFHLLAEMKPYTIKVLVYMVTHMRRDNWIKQLSISQISAETGVYDRYVIKGITQLLEMDVIRRIKSKNTFDYMVSPAFFTRSTLRGLFTVVYDYDAIPNERSPKYSFSTFDEKFES